MRKIKIAQIGLNTYSHGADIFARLKKHSGLFGTENPYTPDYELERYQTLIQACT